MSLQEKEKKLPYPGNQHYDTETLQPYGDESTNRFEVAKRTMPELLQGGKTLLDIGSNKGLMCFGYRHLFDNVVGYEVAPEYHKFSEDVRKHHNIENIKFIHGEMRDVSIDKSWEWFNNLDYDGLAKANDRLLKYCGALWNKYDVVYCGSVHHHFYKDALLYGAMPFLWVHKLAALTEKYLILDGPITSDDPSVKVFAREGNWTEQQKREFNIENIVNALKPHFKLIRLSASERRRHTAVFERVKPDMQYIEDIEVQAMVKEKGERLEANPARHPDSMMKIGHSRTKYDTGLLSDNMYYILNSMPHHFARTEKIIINKKGERIGDVSEWIPGDMMDENKANVEECYQNFIRMNRDMTAIGMLEPHFKITDYKWRLGKLVDVDVDMVMQSVAHTQPYLDNWLKTKSEYHKERIPDFKYIVENWTSKTLYHELVNKC